MEMRSRHQKRRNVWSGGLEGFGHAMFLPPQPLSVGLEHPSVGKCGFS